MATQDITEVQASFDTLRDSQLLGNLYGNNDEGREARKNDIAALRALRGRHADTQASGKQF